MSVPQVRIRFDPRWLDRMVRGRAWIPVLGVLLVGIVGMRVEVLKLNSSIGRSTELAAQLGSANQVLEVTAAKLASPGRISRLARANGMRPAGPMDTHFVTAHGPGELERAIAGLAAANPSAFLVDLENELARNTAAANAVTASTQTSSSTGSSTSTPSSAGGASTPAGSGSAATGSPTTGTSSTTPPGGSSTGSGGSTAGTTGSAGSANAGAGSTVSGTTGATGATSTGGTGLGG